MIAQPRPGPKGKGPPGRGEIQLKNNQSKIIKNEDYIIHLPEKVVVPAEGFNEYRHYVIQTSFTEDKWIKTVKFQVKPKIIHHVALFIMDLSFKHSYISNNQHMGKKILAAFGTTVGEGIDVFGQSDEIGYKLPRNSKFVLEIHYESIGKKVIDDFTNIHISFHSTKPKWKGLTYNITNTKFEISPHVSNYKVKTSYKINRTMFLTRVRPHMHLRGKASSMFIIDPNGVRKRIFSVDPFMKIFEKIYTFQNPVLVKQDSILECINWFDNSVENPINPNPERNVTFGFSTKDEMSQCYFHWQVPVDSNARYLWISNP